MKKIIAILLLASQLATGKTIYVATPEKGFKDIFFNLKNAVSLADDGDSVIIPKGNFVFSNSLSINKSIFLKGQGIKNTIFYRSESTSDATLVNWLCMISISGKASIEGITFKNVGVILG